MKTEDDIIKFGFIDWLIDICSYFRSFKVYKFMCCKSGVLILYLTKRSSQVEFVQLTLQ
jgi:hypothetical protein